MSLIALLLMPPAARSWAGSCPKFDLLGRFSLTFSDQRREDRAGAVDTEPISLDFESEMQLHGTIYVNPAYTADGPQFEFHYDSLTYRSLKPLRFNTFMSGDTMHYTSQDGPGFLNRPHSSVHDSMLACLFTGRAVSVGRNAPEPGLNVYAHNNECGSGEYTRLDAPHAFGLFFNDVLPENLKKGHRWEDLKHCPGYSGLGFRPEVRLTCRVVQVADGKATVVLSGEREYSNRPTTLPNRESATILEGNIRLGGTLVLDTRHGCPLSGEIRIKEHLEYLRLRVSDQVMTKDGSYILRWRGY